MQKLIPGIFFWSLYTLGFTVALPTILYYANDYLATPPQQNAAWAFFYLGLGIVAWLIILLIYGRFYTRMVFTDKNRLEKTAREGRAITATITDSRVVKAVRNTVVFDLRLKFTNLAGTVVEVPYQINDGKPSEKRFEVGKAIEMRANTEGKNAVFVPRAMEVSRIKSKMFLYSFIFLLLLAAAFVYPVFSYRLESNGYGWRFLSFTHPWILVPLINLSALAFIGFIFRLIGKATGFGKQSLHMILYGIRTTGHIIKYNQTGTYINDQPQVKFDIEYTDQQGTKRLATYKKIVSLLDIHKISTDQKEIMYLPNDPQNIVLYEDLVL